MPAKQHDFTATEIKAGALVVISFVILVGFFATVRGCRPQDDTARIYFAYFTDITGLNQGADVRFGGVRVGRVVGVDPDPNDRTLIRVRARVRGDIPVNYGSVATIDQTTFTAEKHLEISTGAADQPLHESGDTLKSSAGGGLFDVPDLEGVVVRLETMLDGLNGLLGISSKGPGGGDGVPVDLEEVLAALKLTLDEGARVARGAGDVIDENRAGINQIVTRLAGLEATATDLMAELDAVIGENRSSIHASFSNLESLTTELNSRIDELVDTLQATLGYLRDLGGNSSDLFNDQRPTIEEMLINLQETTRNLKEFSRILADQPDALIRGRGAHGRKNEEKK